MDELIGEFLTETNEGLQKLDVELVKLEQNPDDKNLLGSIFRVMHTIKGTCGFLGLPRLESVAHAGENILGKLREGELEASEQIISAVLEAIDCIKSIVAYIEKEEKEPDGDDQDLIQRLNKAAESGSEDAPPAEEHNNHSNLFDMQPVEPEEAKPEEDHQLEAAPETKATAVVHAEEKEQKFSENTKKEALEHGLKTAGEKDAAKSNGAIQSVRVNLEMLEGLMLMVSELVLTRNQLLQLSRSQQDTEFSAPIQRLSHITSELQERVMKTRMQPISNAWTPFPRLVRDLSHELGKKVDLKMIGEETELDRQLIETIKDPLTHMVRNSTDHGLERPDERLKAGKPESGTITLKAYHQGGHIIIEIADDGRGMNLERIKAKALSNGLATEDELATMTDQQITQFIFKAGFSTAEKVTSISGRGVGMDVVKTNIEKINGTIELRSVEGKGSTFLIKIPLTLAIMSVLIVECNKEKFGIPQINVIEMVRAGGNSEYAVEKIHNKTVLRLRESLLPLVSLPEILRVPEKPNNNGITYIVVCEVGGYNFGLVVDKVFDTEEIVVKPVAPVLKSIDVYSGSTLLGDGSVIMILDPNGMLKHLLSGRGIMKDTGHGTDKKTDAKEDKQLSKFLILRAGKGAPKAIPLELVSRLEEIDMSAVEYSNDKLVVQYRNRLMYITKLEAEYEARKDVDQHIVVFADRDRIMGLMVEEILDIVEHPMEIVSQLGQDGFIGSMVIDGKTTDLLDVSYFFDQTFGTESAVDKVHSSLNRELMPKILLVDDSPFFRKFIPQVLYTEGYNAVATENAAHALEILEKNQDFALIITDINMPGMSGIDFAIACYDNPLLSHIPVIALSSNVSAKDMPHSNNIKAFVSKTNHDMLLSTIIETISSTLHTKRQIGGKA